MSVAGKEGQLEDYITVGVVFNVGQSFVDICDWT
jgi:hypothetical protein